MPLLTSPIDGSPMQEVERYGIKIDICPTSGGIWLDKGELEKLMHLIREEATNDDSGDRGRGRDDRGRDERDLYRSDHRDYKRRKKKGGMAQIMEILDF